MQSRPTLPLRIAWLNGLMTPCMREKKPDGCGRTANSRRGAHCRPLPPPVPPVPLTLTSPLEMAPTADGEPLCCAAIIEYSFLVTPAAACTACGSHAVRAAAAADRSSSRLKCMKSASRHARGTAPRGAAVSPSVAFDSTTGSTSSPVPSPSLPPPRLPRPPPLLPVCIARSSPRTRIAAT